MMQPCVSYYFVIGFWSSGRARGSTPPSIVEKYTTTIQAFFLCNAAEFWQVSRNSEPWVFWTSTLSFLKIYPWFWQKMKENPRFWSKHPEFLVKIPWVLVKIPWVLSFFRPWVLSVLHKKKPALYHVQQQPGGHCDTSFDILTLRIFLSIYDGTIPSKSHSNMTS